MKTTRAGNRSARQQDGRRQSAFTFTEMIVASSIHMLLLAGVISGHLFGLSMLGFTQAGLSAGDQCRKINNMLTVDVRAAKYLMVGTGSQSSFVECASYSPQQGQAIQLCLTSNTSTYIRYYVDPADRGLKRIAPGDTSPMVLAKYVGTNSGSTNVFTIEDIFGNVTSNRQSSFVLGVSLPFYQMDNPFVLIGPTNYYNFFLLQLKICSRSPD